MSAVSIALVLFWMLVGPAGVAILVTAWLWRRDARRRSP